LLAGEIKERDRLIDQIILILNRYEVIDVIGEAAFSTALQVKLI